METSLPLSIESFSYSWLVNLKPSFESLDDSFRASLDASDEASFIEMDPNLSASKRFFRVSHDFNFDFPVSQSPLTLVHADELISNGFLMPLVVKQLKREAYDASQSVPPTPISSLAQEKVHSSSRIRCSSLRRCRRLSKQLFQKYLEFLRPLCRRIQGQRSGSRVEAIDTGIEEVKNWEYSPATSARTSVAYSADNWRRELDEAAYKGKRRNKGRWTTMEANERSHQEDHHSPVLVSLLFSMGDSVK
ncbi:hypothetical protein RJ639_010863 [Escallonia herrerae]|uniref:Membrane-associated kinase regulator 6 n=1 Tax=Escallonia herrerae TaxID=1293975 RepID=A0AA89ARK3_9ASTE|nr:hypothetical protein RJ639_010863 [Escallonia herrerae]